MPYIGHNPTQAGSFVLLDDIASGFDGDDVTFTLQIGGVDITPTADNLIIALDGVIQHSPEAYTVSGSTLTFTAAPASGVDFYGMLMGQSASIGQGAIGADELSVTGDGSANQMLVSDGDGTMTWKGSGLSATSATGDLIYRNSSGELARLAVGSSGQVLTVASGVPAWETDVESYLPLSGGTMSGALNMGSQAITNAGTITGTFSGNLTGNVTGNTSGTAASVTGAAQTNITSVGTLTSLAITSSSATGLTVDVGLPSSANREIARFQAQSARPIAFGWIDSGSKMSLFTPDNHSLVLGTGAIGTNNLEINASGDTTFSGAITAGGKIRTSYSGAAGIEVDSSNAQDAYIDLANGSDNWTMRNTGNCIWQYEGTEMFKMDTAGYFSLTHTAQNGIKIFTDDTAVVYAYDKSNPSSPKGGITFSHSDGEFHVYTNTFGTNAEAFKIVADNTAYFRNWVYVNNRVMGSSGDIRVGSNDGNEMLHLLAEGTAKIDTAGTTALSIDANQNVVIEDGSLTSKKSFYVTNTGPQMFLTDTDTSRYGSIYYGTRAFIFDNVMNNEALDSVNPWFEWRFATAESGTYTSMMKIERNAYTFNEAYSANFTNSGSNANMHVTAGNGSGRLYLDGSEWGELWFETSDSIKAGIKNNSSGDLILMSGGSTTALTLDSSQQATFSGNGKFGAHGGLENTMTGSRVEINGTWGDPAHGSSSNTKSILRVAGGGHSNTLDFGCSSSSPYNLWIQGTNRGTSGGNASTYALQLNPKGSAVIIGENNTDHGDYLCINNTTRHYARYFGLVSATTLDSDYNLFTLSNTFCGTVELYTEHNAGAGYKKYSFVYGSSGSDDSVIHTNQPYGPSGCSLGRSGSQVYLAAWDYAVYVKVLVKAISGSIDWSN